MGYPTGYTPVEGIPSVPATGSALRALVVLFGGRYVHMCDCHHKVAEEVAALRRSPGT